MVQLVPLGSGEHTGPGNALFLYAVCRAKSIDRDVGAKEEAVACDLGTTALLLGSSKAMDLFIIIF